MRNRLFGIVLSHISIIFVLSLIITGCSNNEGTLTKMKDSSVISEINHSGKFQGYATVCTLNIYGDDWTYSDETYPVYKRDNGTYIIVYNGRDCILTEANPPIGEGYYKLKWKIDNSHYIMDIPTSW